METCRQLNLPSGSHHSSSIRKLPKNKKRCHPSLNVCKLQHEIHSINPLMWKLHFFNGYIGEWVFMRQLHCSRPLWFQAISPSIIVWKNWHSYATFWVFLKSEVHLNVYMKDINDVLVYIGGQSLLMSNYLELLVKLKIYLFAKFDMTNVKLT